MPSNYQQRIALEKRGIDTEGLTKKDLQNSRKLIQRAKMDQRLERAGLLNKQTEGLSQAEIAQRYKDANIHVNQDWFNQNYGGMQPPSPQSLAPNFTPTPTLTPTNLTSPSPQPSPTGGGSTMFKDPVTGKEYYSQASLYTLKGQPRVSQGAVWLNGAQGSPLSGGGGLATLQDAKNGQANWSDVAVDQRKNVLSDPKFYESNQIMQYPKWMQQQILADSNFDWTKLPKWQKTFFEISSNPKIMASPMALAGANVGKTFGPIGTALGAAGGYALGVIGGQQYDPTKGVGEQATAAAKAMGFLNWLSEKTEQGVGYTGQLSDAAIAGLQGNEQAARAAKDILFDPATRQGAWEAGRVTYEYSDTGGRLLTNLFQLLSGETELAESGQDFVLGAAGPVDKERVLGHNPITGKEIHVTDVMQVLMDARHDIRDEINRGGDPDEVTRKYLQDASFYAGSQLQDLVLQSVADPLNVLPIVEAKVLGKAADITGHKVAAEAFGQSSAPLEGLQRYKNLVQTGEALKINRDFKVDQMGALSRWAAGLNKQGQIKAGPFSEAGLLDAPRKNKAGFLQEMVTLTPQSRAQTGAGMFYENIGALLTRFDDPHEAGKYLRALAKNDMETWRELGSRFAESPEFYTVLPALKDFNTTALDGIVAAWDSTQMNRDTLLRVADVLGQEPGKLLDDWTGKDTFDQDFGRIRQRLEASTDPAAKALLTEMEAGRFTPDTLKQMISAFTGEGAAAWHPSQAKAMMLDKLGEHFDKWVSERLMLDQTPEAKSAFFRTAALMKSAQSILLLGASPGYAIQNGLSNMVHRAATGNFGYLTPKQISGFMDKFGVNPARFEEGVGIGGMVEQAAGKGKVHTEAQIKAVKGKGALTDAREKVSSLSGKMPFSKLSSWFEKNEGRQAFVIGMKQFWGQSWRRGKGFKTMRPELVQVLNGMGVDPNHIYAAIEAGLNQADVERALMGRQRDVQARALVDAAAQKTGLTATQAADMLEKVGVLDTLDSFLKGQTSRDGVSAAFKRAESVAQDWMDRQAGEDLKAQAEHVAQRVAIEQPAAAFEVIQKAGQDFTDTWLEHYYDFGELTRDLDLIPDEAMKSKAYDNAYAVSGERFRRVHARNGANYQGIFEAWGKGNDPRAREALSAFGEIDRVMADAYTQMRDIRKGTHERHRGNLRSSEFFDDVAKDQKTIDKIFKDAFAAKKVAEVRAGKALGDIFESLYGPAAGEAARLWWDDVLKMNDEIVKREGEFRKSIEGKSREERAAAKQKYYAETKALQITEQLKINEEGLARLERVVRRGGGSGLDTASPTRPPEPTPPTVEGQRSQVESEPLSAVDEVNGLMAAAEQRKSAEVTAQAQRVASVLEVAEEYGYSRANRNDIFALIGALRKSEYGGMADLTSLDDPRATPEFIREVMENRKRIKDEQAAIEAAQVEAASQPFNSGEWNRNFEKAAETGDLTALYELIGQHPEDLGNTPRINKGLYADLPVIDYVARNPVYKRQEVGNYRLNLVEDLEGPSVIVEKITKHRDGSTSYEITNTYPETIQDAWTTLYNSEGRPIETWNDYMSRVADEVVARVEEATRDVSIEESRVRAEAAVRAQEVRGEYAMTRNLLKEKFIEVFDITEEQATAWMEISDGVASWYERAMGDASTTAQSGEEFYSRYYGDVRKSAISDEPLADSLEQGIEPINRRMTAEETSNYARALVRGGADELRRAVVNESVKADRIAILNEAHKLDAKMAEGVARKVKDVLFQDGEFVPSPRPSPEGRGSVAKGAVAFDGDGIKATIHAFEGKDFSTVVHENAHVFRRMLSDVAERTGDARVKADLKTLEDWAGVKDGQWNRAAEEKFARGFERYLAEGKAPTPALKRAFDSFKHWMLAIYKSFTGSAIDVKLTPSVKAVFDNLVAGDDATRNIGIFSKDLYVDMDALNANLVKRNAAIKARLVEIQKLKREGKWVEPGREAVSSDASTAATPPLSAIEALFQDADQPVGALDSASGFMPQSAVMEEGWMRHIKPLLGAMEEEAVSRQQSAFSGEGAMKDMSPEGQGMMRKYMKEVQNDMATSKLAAMRWGEQRRDFAMLNYNRRYGFDRWLDFGYPYQFFYTRSLMTWAARGLDAPAWFSNYARLRMQQQRYERDIPERLRNKIKIPAPWMPDWMGDALYIDPLQSLFTPANFLRPFERMERDKNQQQVEAERIMQAWAEDGKYSHEQIAQAVESKSGEVWERAQEEAMMNRESEISNPMDFFNTMFGPAWYLSTPMNLMGIGKGDPNKVSTTPLTNTARGIEAVTQGTFAEPVGQLIGLLGKPEEWARKKLGLPTLGEYGEYYTKRQIANMVIEGKITSEQAQLAMIEKQGEWWDEATQRVKLELAMRVPTMSALYAGLHGKGLFDGLKQAGAAALPSLFGSGLLPAGELEYRGLKEEWNEAWKKYDAGDTKAVTAFFDEHPEYEAYLAKGKDDDELMQDFLVGQVWDGYMALGPTNQKAARAQMGEMFGDAFLNKETRSYESIPTEQLMEWARMLNKMVPSVTGTSSTPTITAPLSEGQQLNLYDPNVTRITDEFFNQRSQYFPDYYEVQNGYYALPKSERAGYLMAHPELKEYWSWKKKWEKSYPDLVPILKGQVFKTVDTSAWPPGLELYVQAYAYGGERLPKGAYKALEQQWIMDGRPYDDLNVWLNSQVVPAMLYEQ